MLLRSRSVRLLRVDSPNWRPFDSFGPRCGAAFRRALPQPGCAAKPATGGRRTLGIFGECAPGGYFHRGFRFAAGTRQREPLLPRRATHSKPGRVGAPNGAAAKAGRILPVAARRLANAF